MFTDYGSWIYAGFRMFRRRLRVSKKGTRRYTGIASQMCNQIVDDCWNGTYLSTSTGHFSGFYIRDFGWVVQALVDNGFGREAIQTIEYALKQYESQRLTTTISPKGHCFDVFTYAPDSLAWLLYTLRVVNRPKIVETYRSFLQDEITKFQTLCLDEDTGLITTKKYFSSIKDHAKRYSATYDNWMYALIAREAKTLGFQGLPSPTSIVSAIIKSRWTGSFFCDDAKSQQFSADANVFPFWLGLLRDSQKWNSIVKTITTRSIDNPVGLAYGSTDSHKHNFAHRLAENYEGTARWMHLGLLYLDTLRMQSSKNYTTVLEKTKSFISRDRNVLEVYNTYGSLFKTMFYQADEGMIWAAILLDHFR